MWSESISQWPVVSPLSLRRYSVENKGNNICILFNLLTSFVCLGVVDFMHTLIHTHLCNSSEMRWSLNIFPLFESGLSLWFTLTCAMQQKWQNRTSEILFLSALCLLLLPSWDMSILSCSGVANSWDPLDCSPPGSSVHGVFQAKILEWVFLLQGIFPTQRLNLYLLHSLRCRWILYPLSHWECLCPASIM